MERLWGFVLAIWDFDWAIWDLRRVRRMGLGWKEGREGGRGELIDY